jgi:hypothetical protein
VHFNPKDGSFDPELFIAPSGMPRMQNNAGVKHVMSF